MLVLLLLGRKVPTVNVKMDPASENFDSGEGYQDRQTGHNSTQTITEEVQVLLG